MSNDNNSARGCGCLSIIIAILLFKFGVFIGHEIKDFFKEKSFINSVEDVEDIIDVNINLDKNDFDNQKYQGTSQTTISGKTYTINNISDFGNFLYNLKLEAQHNDKLSEEIVPLYAFFANMHLQYLNRISTDLNNREFVNKITNNTSKVSRAFINCYIKERNDGMPFSKATNIIKGCIDDYTIEKNNGKTAIGDKEQIAKFFSDYMLFLSILLKSNNKDHNQEAIILFHDIGSLFFAPELSLDENLSYEDTLYRVTSIYKLSKCYLDTRNKTMSYNEALNLKAKCGKNFVKGLSGEYQNITGNE